jgi:hypothetical protein
MTETTETTHRAHTESFESATEQVNCVIYTDGDVVVTHGTRGNCVNLRDASGYDPLLDVCDNLDIDKETTDEIMEFVQSHSGMF